MIPAEREETDWERVVCITAMAFSQRGQCHGCHYANRWGWGRGGNGGGGVFFQQQQQRFFQLWLLSAQGIYWKGEVKMCELSQQSHIT